MAVNPKVQEIESRIFTPMLQLAMQHSQDAGNKFDDTVMGAANAYINMLVGLVGKETALEMLRSQVKFLESQ